MDADGYPDEDELTRISEWHNDQFDWSGLMAFIRPLWRDGYWETARISLSPGYRRLVRQRGHHRCPAHQHYILGDSLYIRGDRRIVLVLHWGRCHGRGEPIAGAARS